VSTIFLQMKSITFTRSHLQEGAVVSALYQSAVTF